MDVLEAIQSRRSIRAFVVDKPVPMAMVRECLRAAMHAPSAGDQELWHFLVVNDRTALEAISNCHPHAGMLSEAPLAVVVCGEADPTKARYPDLLPLDCAAATQNLLLAAHAQGLGSVWLGIHPRPDREAHVRSILGLPDHILPFAIVPLGWPAETPAQPDRFMEERIRVNHW